MRTPAARFAVVALVVVGVAAGFVAGVGVVEAAHEEPDRTIFAAELDADGDAVVYNVTSFDLSVPDERERFEAFEENETAQSAWLDVVVADMERAAADGREATGLEMAVHDASVETYTAATDDGDEYGRLEVRADWKQLAFAEPHRVVVTEPFRGGYEPGPRRVALHAPEGYVRGTMQPTPLRAQAASGLWNPQTSDFSVFFAEFVDPDAVDDGDSGGEDDGGSEADDEGPSDVGALLGAVGLAAIPVAAVLLALRRRSS